MPKKNLPGGDPLLTGGSPLPRTPGKTGPGPATGTVGAGAPGQPQASVVPPVPGIPTSGTGFSPAALAGGRPSPFDRSRDLHIADPPRGPAGGWTAPTHAPRSNGSGVTLRPPEPMGDSSNFPAPPAPPPPPNPGVNTPGSPNVLGTPGYEQALAQLQARGVLWQVPEMVAPGEWQFRCAIRHPHKPDQQRTYQAKGRDLLDAIQAVLQQIDRDMGRAE